LFNNKADLVCILGYSGKNTTPLMDKKISQGAVYFLATPKLRNKVCILGYSGKNTTPLMDKKISQVAVYFLATPKLRNKNTPATTRMG